MVLQPRHQLVDLNKEYMNCEITFECKAADATKDFEIIVVNQDQLDTVDLSSLEMKKTRGGFVSGNIVADENRQQNYFLVLKSVNEEPVEVDVNISLNQIEPDPNKIASQQTMTQNEIMSAENTASYVPPIIVKKAWYAVFREKPVYLFIVLVVILLIVGGIYYMYKRSSKQSTTSSSCEKDDTSSEVSSEAASSTGSKSDNENSAAVLRILQNKKSDPVK
jgi:hypothetical protein